MEREVSTGGSAVMLYGWGVENEGRMAYFTCGWTWMAGRTVWFLVKTCKFERFRDEYRIHLLKCIRADWPLTIQVEQIKSMLPCVGLLTYTYILKCFVITITKTTTREIFKTKIALVHERRFQRAISCNLQWWIMFIGLYITGQSVLDVKGRTSCIVYVRDHWWDVDIELRLGA